MSSRKTQTLERARRHLFPHRIDAFSGLGIDLVIGKREGYRFWDVDGRELMDFHLNGGTYNLGHRNPELLATLRQSLEYADVGNHHFANPARAELGEPLAQATGLQYSVFTASGAEANEVAIRSARRYTGRRRIVALDCGYHGRTGLAGAAGADASARFFHSDYPQEFLKLPFGDLDAMAATLASDEIAAVLMETIPATMGFPIPPAGYLAGVRELCDRYGVVYIADEVQTGLGRTGRLWGVDCWDVSPDILITGKGLSGGLYPVSAAVLSADVGHWLAEDGWGYVSTFGGAEPGCAVGCRALELCADPRTLAHARHIADYIGAGLRDIQQRRPFLREVRQQGLVIGLKTDAEDGGLRLSGALFQRGIWAMFAGYDLSVLQFKPGLLIDEAYCDDALERLDLALQDVARGTA